LEIKDNDEPWGNGVTATWTATDMKPGDSYDFLIPQINLRNVGSDPIDHVEITCDYAVIEEDPQTESDTDPYTNLNPDSMAKKMIITSCTYANGETVNCLTDSNPDRRIEDQDGDGKITFYDLKNDPLDSLPSMGGGTSSFQMSVKFSDDAGNDFQGDIFDLTMIFTLNQDSSQ